MVMSACQIYERLEMYEESIECVACSGQTDKAKTHLCEWALKRKGGYVGWGLASNSTGSIFSVAIFSF